jgi:hypothetical protein
VYVYPHKRRIRGASNRHRAWSAGAFPSDCGDSRTALHRTTVTDAFGAGTDGEASWCPQVSGTALVTGPTTMETTLRLLARHRPAVLTASALAVLAAATVAPLAASATTGSDAPSSEPVLAVPATHEVRQMTSGAVDGLQQRQARAETKARAKAAVAKERRPSATAQERRTSARAAAAGQAARSAQRVAADPRSLAASMAAERYGWGPEQFACLDNLWVKESGWDHTAKNPSSGAYGIPQSLPGDKMATHGADWRTNPATQISWGLDYISQVYGTPCAAWGHSQSVNWY